jgi:zinc transporter ZupT
VVPVLVALGSFVTTLAGGFAALRFRDYQHPILGLAAGLMLGVVAFDLVPEALSLQSGELFGVRLALLAAVVGFLTLHVVERSVAIHRAHEGEYAGHLHAPGVGVFAGSALVVHSLMDGFAIGAAFQAGGTVGVVVSIAVLSHDFADGFNTYTITSLYGNDRRRALTLLIADALAPSSVPPARSCSPSRTTSSGSTSGSSRACSSTWQPATSSPRPTPTTRAASPLSARSSVSASCGWSSVSPAEQGSEGPAESNRDAMVPPLPAPLRTAPDNSSPSGLSCPYRRAFLELAATAPGGGQRYGGAGVRARNAHQGLGALGRVLGDVGGDRLGRQLGPIAADVGAR